MSNQDGKKIEGQLSKEDLERLELLRKAHEKQGKQLRIDIEKGSLKEINEIREILGKKNEDPDEKYRLYYTGITNLLKKYLPKGKQFQEARYLIYDEKNIFLNRGKRKSDNDGIRKSDGRMTYQPVMEEMLDLVTKWVSESLNPIDLFNMLYDLNEKHGYGHELYDQTSIHFQNNRKKEKGS